MEYQNIPEANSDLIDNKLTKVSQNSVQNKKDRKSLII